MPKNFITTRQLSIILGRIAGASQYLLPFNTLPETEDFDHPIKREKFIRILYTLTQEMPNIEVISPETDYTTIQSELDKAKEKRTASNLKSYTLIQRKTCFCLEDYVRPVRYEVQDGVAQLSGAEFADDNTKFAIKMDLLAISQAFDLIQDAINKKSAHIDVSYDPIFGYPTSIFIDQDERIADEEIQYNYTLILDGQGNNNLQGTRSLQTFDGTDVSTYEAELIFSANALSANICNIVGGTYAIGEDDKLTFSSMFSTKMACQDETLNQVENLFGQIKHPAYTLTEGEKVLTLISKGHTFVFNRQ